MSARWKGVVYRTARVGLRVTAAQRRRCFGLLASIAATDAALAGDLGPAVRPVLAEQRAITQQRRAARALGQAPPPA